MPRDQMPWEDEPYIDPAAATERAIRGAQSARIDPNAPHVRAWARAAFEREQKRLESAGTGYRNATLFSACRNLFEIVASQALDADDVVAMLREACRINGHERDDGEAMVVGTIASGRRKGLDNPRPLPPKPLRGFVLTDEPVKIVTVSNIIDLERNFWLSRDSLRAIYIGALAQMCSPWAVLGYCVARALTIVRPSTALPALIGGVGSLNWFCAIAAPSGGGKGSAATVARQLVNQTVLQRNLGSGEGLIDAYVKPANKETGEPRGLNEAIMFVADEVDTMHALASRSGSTMSSLLRSAFSGETIGFSYRQASSQHLEYQTYRLTLVVNVQPAKAGALFDDSEGGTLQRFMWFPGVDPRITSEPPLSPGELTLPPYTAWQYPRTLQIPWAATELIRDERARSMQGSQDALDGHALFIREKFAYGLAVLDGRDEMNDEDWRLSGTASRVSDMTREWVASQLDVAARADAEKRGTLQGVSIAAADEEKMRVNNKRLSRIAKWIMGKLGEASATTGALVRAAPSRDRNYIAPVLAKLEQEGAISRDANQRWVKVV